MSVCSSAPMLSLSKSSKAKLQPIVGGLGDERQARQELAPEHRPRPGFVGGGRGGRRFPVAHVDGHRHLGGVELLARHELRVLCASPSPPGVATASAGAARLHHVANHRHCELVMAGPHGVACLIILRLSFFRGHALPLISAPAARGKPEREKISKEPSLPAGKYSTKTARGYDRRVNLETKIPNFSEFRGKSSERESLPYGDRGDEERCNALPAGASVGALQARNSAKKPSASFKAVRPLRRRGAPSRPSPPRRRRRPPPWRRPRRRRGASTAVDRPGVLAAGRAGGDRHGVHRSWRAASRARALAYWKPARDSSTYAREWAVEFENLSGSPVARGS